MITGRNLNIKSSKMNKENMGGMQVSEEFVDACDATIPWK